MIPVLVMLAQFSNNIRPVICHPITDIQETVYYLLILLVLCTNSKKIFDDGCHFMVLDDWKFNLSVEIGTESG